MVPRIPSNKKKMSVVASLFAFCLVWGFGSALQPVSFERFSNILRYVFSSIAPLPIAGTMFDYYLEGANNYRA